MITVRRTGLLIETDDKLEPAQGSENVPVTLENDSTYAGYMIEPHVGWFDGMKERNTIAVYKNGTFHIPREAMLKNGKMKISIKLKKDDIAYMTNQIVFDVKPAPNAVVILPTKETWEQAVDNFLGQWEESELVPVKNELDKLVQSNKELQQTSQNQQDAVNDLLDETQQKFENGDFTPKFSVGTVANGEEPSVNMTGNMMNPILNFIFEKGDKGISMRIKNWIANTQYLNNNDYIDCVAYNGTLYVCIKTHTSSSSITPLNTTYWLVGASKGDPNVLDIGTVVEGDTAQATITGEAPNQTLNLVLPKADTNSLEIGTVQKGDNAAASITGEAPNQILNLTLPKGDPNTLAIGTVQKGVNPAATITGEAPNQTLNLTLPKGDKGDKGDPNTLTIGTVVEGENADASIRGTSPNQILDLTLPKADPNTLKIGTVQKGENAQVTITGEAPNQTLNLTLPKGDKGDKGDPNTLAIGTVVEGENANASIRGTSPNQILDLTLPKADPNTLKIGTVQKGENAQVTITGEAPNQTLNLTLPKGDKGDGMLAKHIVTSLPTVGGESDIYFLVKGEVYTTYMYVDGNWIAIGNGIVDLSNYYTKEESERIVYHGKNLLKETWFPSNQTSWTLKNNAKIESEKVGSSYNSFVSLKYDNGSSDIGQSFSNFVKSGAEFTLSFLARIDKGSTLIVGDEPIHVSVFGENQTSSSSLLVASYIYSSGFTSSEWQKFSYTFKTTKDFEQGIDITFRQNSNFGIPVHIDEVMLEYGSYTHDWTRSDCENCVTSESVKSIVTLTQSEYDALETIDEKVVYLILEG